MNKKRKKISISLHNAIKSQREKDKKEETKDL